MASDFRPRREKRRENGKEKQNIRQNRHKELPHKKGMVMDTVDYHTGDIKEEKTKRAPQKYRQCWAILKVAIENSQPIRTRSGLLAEMERIEKMVGG